MGVFPGGGGSSASVLLHIFCWQLFFRGFEPRFSENPSNSQATFVPQIKNASNFLSLKTAKQSNLGPILNVEQNLFFDFWDFWFGEEFGAHFCQIALE